MLPFEHSLALIGLEADGLAQFLRVLLEQHGRWLEQLYDVRTHVPIDRHDASLARARRTDLLAVVQH